MTFEEIVADPRRQDARTTLLALFDEACRAVSPSVTMPPTIPVSRQGRTLVIAIGKAAAEMMRIAQLRAASRVEGLVVTRYGHLPKQDASWPGVEVIEAGHPVPDENSVRGARRALDLAHELEAGDQLLVLLSGGGSALAAAPAEGVTLEDKQQVTRELLRCGATIAEINCVRKHLSGIKGGRLAVAAGAAALTTWIISDVPGDDPSLVSSGPTVADRSSLEMAREILARYRITAASNVRRALENAANETPAPDSPGLAGSQIQVIGRAQMAIDAAASLAMERGFAVTSLGDQLQAEARLLAAGHAAMAREMSVAGPRRAIVSGGEATVTVNNAVGRGGPNLEYLLGLAIVLDGAEGVSAIACDTDGIDGNTDAAGAMVFPDTLERARSLGLDPPEFLAGNRTYDFFKALDDLVVTGPTLTNVNDFRTILIDRVDARESRKLPKKR